MKEIRSNWQSKRFLDTVVLQRGFDLPMSARRGGSVAVFGSNGQVGTHNEHPSGVPVPTLTVGRSGSVGKVCFSDTGVWPLNTTLYAKDYCGNDPKYIYYWLRHFDLARYAQGVSVPTLNRNSFGLIEVDVPTTREQQVIAKVLDRCVEALNTENLIEKTLSELKRATMTSLFTRGLHGEAQKETEIGPIPENWTIHKMSSVCEFLPGFAFKSNDYTAEGVRLFKISNVSFGTTSWAETSFLPCEYLKINKKYVLQPNDIVLAMTRPIVQGGIKVTRIDQSDLPALLNQRVCKIIPSKVQSIYLYQLLFSSYFVNGIDGGAGGSQQPNISTEKIGSIWLPFPQSTDEQIEIGKILDAIDQKIALHKQKKSVLDELFRSLLHKLMTGEISVEDLDLSALTSEEPQPKTEAEAPS